MCNRILIQPESAGLMEYKYSMYLLYIIFYFDRISWLCILVWVSIFYFASVQ